MPIGLGAQHVLAAQPPLEPVDGAPIASGVTALVLLIGLSFLMPLVVPVGDYALLLEPGRLAYLMSESIKAAELQDPLIRPRIQFEQQSRASHQAGARTGSADGYRDGHGTESMDGYTKGRAEGFHVGTASRRAEG